MKNTFWLNGEKWHTTCHNDVHDPSVRGPFYASKWGSYGRPQECYMSFWWGKMSILPTDRPSCTSPSTMIHASSALLCLATSSCVIDAMTGDDEQRSSRGVMSTKTLSQTFHGTWALWQGYWDDCRNGGWVIHSFTYCHSTIQTKTKLGPPFDKRFDECIPVDVCLVGLID